MTLALLIAGLLGQTTVIADPAVSSRKANVESCIGGKNCLDVKVVEGGGSSGGASTQGLSNDGGYPWHVDVEQLKGAAPSATNPMPSRLTDGTTFYKPTTPTDTQPVSAASLPLPAGAATEGTLATLLTTNTFTARLGTLGQKTMSASAPVVIASDQPGIPVTGTFWQSTQPVSLASVPLPPGAATDATLSQLLDGGIVSLGRAPSGALIPTLVDSMGSAVVITRPVPPVNPFLPRCNPVRRTGCQP